MCDEAEWHFWNSHEKNLSNEVWTEIYEWRLKGDGMRFITQHFDMIAKKTGVSKESLGALIGLQDEHLSKNKW